MSTGEEEEGRFIRWPGAPAHCVDDSFNSVRTHIMTSFEGDMFPGER